jgi:hypothetical protein
VIRIDVLPDDVLLDIFDFYVDISLSNGGRAGIEAWQSLVHVCRRWRSVVLESPRRLNLRLHCAPDTPAKDKLDVWPALPLIVWGDMGIDISSGTDNIIAALVQSNRVCEVTLLSLEGWQLEEVSAAKQVPFPEMTELQLSSLRSLRSHDETPPVIPDSFLDGSAPRLQYFELNGIPFPGLPKLLLSASRLVCLRLSDIPHSGYISPEAMVASLSVLSSLRTLSLEFRSPQSRPDWESRSLPPPNRSILPTLDYFRFKGVTEYLEELVTRIDTPKLRHTHINFFDQIDFDCPRLAQFIDRTPTFGAHDTAYVRFGDLDTSVTLLIPTLEIVISWSEPDRQLSSIAQVCNSLHHLSTVVHLYIERRPGERVFQIDAIENTQWLQLFLPFTAVEFLYLSKTFAPGVAAALQELVGGRITEVLPSLQSIIVQGIEPSGPIQENIGQFVAARQLSDHPIAISVWDEDSDMESM